MPATLRPPTEEEKAVRRLAEERKQQVTLALDKKQLVIYLSLLVLKTMVINHHLKDNKEFQQFLEKQNQEILAFADTVQNLANNITLSQEKDLLLRFADFLKNNTILTLNDKSIQNEMNSFFDKMSPELLEKLQHPSIDLLRKLDDLSEQFIKKIAPDIQKEVDTTMNKPFNVFKRPEPTPGKTPSEKDQDKEEQYSNLLGLLTTTITGSLQNTPLSNLGNPLSLLNGMRALFASSTANVDSWNKTKEEIEGAGTTLLNPQSLDAETNNSQATASTLPTPFDTKLTKK